MSDSDIYYYVGNVAEDLEDAIVLGGLWWEETDTFKEHGVKYSPRREMYIQMEESQTLLMLCGRDRRTDKLVSLYMASLIPHPFTKDFSMMAEIVWCVHPDYRKKGVIFGLLCYIEKIAGEVGGRNPILVGLGVSQEDKLEPLRKLLVKRGFKPMDATFTKKIGG